MRMCKRTFMRYLKLRVCNSNLMADQKIIGDISKGQICFSTFKRVFNWNKVAKQIKFEALRSISKVFAGHIWPPWPYVVHSYFKPALSNPFATCHIWRMVLKMWRMALLPNILKMGCFVQKTQKSINFYFIYNLKTSKWCETCGRGHKICKQTW